MPSLATSRNRFEKQGTGENPNTWGQRLNEKGLDLIDEALDGYQSIALTGDYTLTSVNYATDQARKRYLKFTGVAATVTIPSVSKLYFIENATSGVLTISTGASTTASLASGAKQWVVTDGSGVYADTSAPVAVAAAAAASSSANSAATSAINASASASAASTSASSSSTSATNAAISAAAAAASAASLNTSNLVQKTGDETIGGVKSFTSGVRINGNTLDGLTSFGVSLVEAANAGAANTLLGASWTLLSTASTWPAATVVQTGLDDYEELLIVLSTVQHSNSGSDGLSLHTSENNGSSYGSSGVSLATANPISPLSGVIQVSLVQRGTLVVAAHSNPVGNALGSIAQTAKANAVRLSWTTFSFGGGTVYIYAR